MSIIRAVIEVESRGSGFIADGRPAILFERHIFYRRLKRHQIDPARFTKGYGSVLSPQPGGYTSGTGEYKRLAIAEQIHKAAAHESASWGAFQIMGYHWEALAYDSIDDFVTRMYLHEVEHLDAFVRFVSADRSIRLALASKQWARFARAYNGQNHMRFWYAHRLAAAYRKYAAMEDSARPARPNS